MKEYDYAHQMNRPVPLKQHAQPPIKEKAQHAPTRKNAPRS